ncbi:MAG: hypothetical protein M5U18_02460 [Dehalococcoidia bacterium]|nr:hypothetical protein [Dehalococcoidia bacterium]
MRTILIGLIHATWLLAACAAETAPGDPATLPSEPRGAAALEQMANAFDGGPSQAVIKARLDAAFALYGLQPTEDNYSRAGSTLVSLRRANGATEMAILDYMICSHVPGVRMTFPEAAAVASVMLKSGDRC